MAQKSGEIWTGFALFAFCRADSWRLLNSGLVNKSWRASRASAPAASHRRIVIIVSDLAFSHEAEDRGGKPSMGCRARRSPRPSA